MRSEHTPWVVAIGASGAQGLSDIQVLVAALPSDLAAIVMIVLHRPWDRPSHLQAVLSRASALPVLITEEDERFKIGRIYIGEPAEHLSLAASSFGELVKDPEQKYRNRTVDLLFNSVAAHAGSRMIGVILSGSLDDGSRGLAAIHEAGGITMVLTPGSSPTEHGMGENAITFDGPVDLIGSARQIAQRIQDLVAPAR
ncbi:chemotaxis protein CheB [Geminicoccus sp.]|jgi:two-component system chemotaxis response regulator CheB|uniref:chemotaxis protein CheB n=1 Tax=Geminicoccus sp. TaxID=2024832 RepID=UPI0032C244CC